MAKISGRRVRVDFERNSFEVKGKLSREVITALIKKNANVMDILLDAVNRGELTLTTVYADNPRS